MITFTQGLALVLLIAATLSTSYGFHLWRRLKAGRQTNSDVRKSFLLLWIMVALFWIRTVIFCVIEFEVFDHPALDAAMVVLTLLLVLLAGVCMVRMLRTARRVHNADEPCKKTPDA